VALAIDAAPPKVETPALRQARSDAERQLEAEAIMRDDPVAQALQRRLDAEWLPDTIRSTPTPSVNSQPTTLAGSPKSSA
jgi:hypothetical protein